MAPIDHIRQRQQQIMLLKAAIAFVVLRRLIALASICDSVEPLSAANGDQETFATDNSGNAVIAMTLDGLTQTTTLPVTQISTAGYAAGSSHTVVVTATDAGSNTTSSTMTFGIRNPAVTSQPSVEITSPSDGTNVSAPVTITGTANSQGLLYYQLWYSPVGKSQFLEFSRGTTSVTSSPLGSLDPTLLKNGLYDILLTVTDVNGATQSSMVTYQISGDMKVGNFTVSFTDVNIPVAGIPVTVTRTYDSRDKASRDFGYGWSIDIQNIKIEESTLQGVGWYEIAYGTGLSTTYCIQNDFGPYVAITLPDGKVEEFDMAVTATDTYHQSGIPANCQYLMPFESLTLAIGYNARPGTTSTLRPKNLGQLYFTSGLLLDLDTLEPYDPNGYILTTVEGMVFDLDQSFGVKGITDPNGNTVTYNTAGITHSAGKGVTFVRDSQKRITKITDPNNGVITYEYNTKGDLASVTDQLGNKTTYTYNSNHGLTDIKDPRGITPVRNIYDKTGRLTAHIDAYGNKIEYSHDIAGRQEIVKDRNGNLTVFIYDNKGRVLQKTDPAGNSTTFTYDAVGNKLSETDPLGNTTTWTYDSKKNRLSETHSTSSGQAVITSWTYNEQGKVLAAGRIDPCGYMALCAWRL
ncbi:MAG: hypothetical protein HZB62_03300 [Nitrospirae bacterium]|nr:hypothetical protein [Nitrospirota bacterium]